jgi:hypothetical protein
VTISERIKELTEIRSHAKSLVRDLLLGEFPVGEIARVGNRPDANYAIIRGPCLGDYHFGDIDLCFENGNVWSRPVSELTVIPWRSVPIHWKKAFRVERRLLKESV